jgi:hypothetical protein
MPWVQKTDDELFEIAELIFGDILPIILIIIRTIGNILCINYLLHRKYRRSRSTYIYSICLFLADNLSLYQ